MKEQNPTFHRIGKIKSVGIVAKPHSNRATEVVQKTVPWLKQQGVEVVLETETAYRSTTKDCQTCTKDELPQQVDLALVIGGDGTLLGLAHSVAQNKPKMPILAVNCGHLGFLTEITLAELNSALLGTIKGQARIDERQMLHSRVVRNSVTATDRFVLNDVVIGRSTNSNIISLTISAGDKFITRYRADGLIISTPTGSTAYNLAAGGPIVHPAVDAIVLTPIAPHTLTNRPIVIPNTGPVRIKSTLPGPFHEAHASFDGQFNFELTDGDVVEIERAPQPLHVVRAESRDYFSVLREKLKWGER